MNCSATRKSKIFCARSLKFYSVCGVKICCVNLDRENNFLTLHCPEITFCKSVMNADRMSLLQKDVHIAENKMGGCVQSGYNYIPMSTFPRIIILRVRYFKFC